MIKKLSLGLIVLFALFLTSLTRAEETNATEAVTTVLNPDPPGTWSAPTVELSDERREEMLARKRQIEENAAATTSNNPPSPPGLPRVEGYGTEIRH